MFARELYRFYLPFDAALAEAAGNNDAVIALQHCGSFRPALLKVFRIHPGDPRMETELRRRELDRLNNREIGVREHKVSRIKIFPDNRDGNLRRLRVRRRHCELLPRRERCSTLLWQVER